MLVDSWDVVERFERRMAAHCGAPFAVSVDTCTAAIFLCLRRRVLTNNLGHVVLPGNTYLGVAASVLHAGVGLYVTEPWNWKGQYLIGDGVYDYACRMKKDMYARDMQGMVNSPLACLSFQYRKHLKIGRGGMILTDSAEHAAWFRKARFLGRAEPNGVPEFLGWHMFMEPERAARGLVLMDSLPDDPPDLEFSYPDLRQYEVLRG